MMNGQVIVADDSSDMRSLFEVVLVSGAYEVVCLAADGALALRCWQHHRDTDLAAVILDQRMPGMTGLEVADSILAERPEQTVILVSAHLDAATRRDAARLGVRMCLDKSAIVDLPQHLGTL